MATSTISVEVDADTARAFSQASAEEKQRIQLLLALRLHELLTRPAKPLKEVMNEIGAAAQRAG